MLRFADAIKRVGMKTELLRTKFAADQFTADAVRFLLIQYEILKGNPNASAR